MVTDFGGSGFYTGAIVVFKEQLARIGIDVQIRQVEQDVFIQEASPDGNFNYDPNINTFGPRHVPQTTLSFSTTILAEATLSLNVHRQLSIVNCPSLNVHRQLSIVNGCAQELSTT